MNDGLLSALFAWVALSVIFKVGFSKEINAYVDDRIYFYTGMPPSRESIFLGGLIIVDLSLFFVMFPVLFLEFILDLANNWLDKRAFFRKKGKH